MFQAIYSIQFSKFSSGYNCIPSKLETDFFFLRKNRPEFLNCDFPKNSENIEDEKELFR